MLFILRKIRNQLIHNNKVTTYVIYAFGEIALVVIGILIAVSIDTWNEGIKERRAESHYLSNLQDDLALQLKETGSCLNSESDILKSINNIGKEIESGFSSNNINHLNIRLTRIMQNRTLNIYRTTFEELKSSGNINIISNKELRSEIIGYYQFLERVSLVLPKYEQQQTLSLVDKMIEYSLFNFDIRFGQINDDLEAYLNQSGEDILNPVRDSLVINKFNSTALQKLKSEEGSLQLNNIISARNFSALVSIRMYKDIQRNTEQLQQKVNDQIKKLSDK